MSAIPRCWVRTILAIAWDSETLKFYRGEWQVPMVRAEVSYASNESLEFSRKSGSLLTPSSGPIWRPVTRLVTRNPHRACFAVVSADEVRTRTRWFAWVRASHLSGMETHVRIEVEPAFLTQAEVAVLLGVPERTLEGWRLTKSGRRG